MQESGEMYLENILILGKEKNTVRAIDIVERMGFSKPSVSRALGVLKKDECIIVDHNGNIALLEKGRLIAEKIYERHRMLSQMLMALGVDKNIAEEDACKMEHVISDCSFEALLRHYNEMKAQ